MTSADLIPIVMAGESALASLVYLIAGDWRHALYWAAACLINIAVTV